MALTKLGYELVWIGESVGVRWTRFCCLWLMLGIMMQVDRGIEEGIAEAWQNDIPNYSYELAARDYV